MNGDSNGIAGAYIKATSRKSNFPQVRFEKFLVKKRITARFLDIPQILFDICFYYHT